MCSDFGEEAMPEEAVETQELKEKLEEAQELAHEAREGAAWMTWLSLSTAIIAVLAAIASLESGSYANDAIIQKNEAVLHQSKADDAWGHYQGKGVEATVYAAQAEGASRPEIATRLQAEAERKRKERAEIKQQAEEEEKRVAEMDEKSDHSMHVHHEFAKSVTLFQVAIAMAAIAALTRRKPVWWVSLAASAVGAAFFVIGLVQQ
jgi:hypothetical protein